MSIARFRPRFTVRRLMVAVAIVGLVFGCYDQYKVIRRTNRYRGKAGYYEYMERKCRKIDAMDPVTRAREDAEALDDLFLHNPAWNRRMIPYYQALKRKYEEAASHPRLPVEPDPPAPYVETNPPSP